MKLKYEKLLSNLAFNCNLRRYNEDPLVLDLSYLYVPSHQFPWWGGTR